MEVLSVNINKTLKAIFQYCNTYISIESGAGAGAKSGFDYSPV